MNDSHLPKWLLTCRIFISSLKFKTSLHIGHVGKVFCGFKMSLANESSDVLDSGIVLTLLIPREMWSTVYRDGSTERKSCCPTEPWTVDDSLVSRPEELYSLQPINATAQPATWPSMSSTHCIALTGRDVLSIAENNKWGSCSWTEVLWSSCKLFRQQNDRVLKQIWK